MPSSLAPFLRSTPSSLAPFLRSTPTIDWQHPRVLALAETLADARTCFEWVRDEIAHTNDYELEPITCAASEVLAHRTGFCYAKSHLLAALLRAKRIPCGFVYQRLTADELGQRFCLHGLNAVWLEAFGWYRVDARGRRAGAGETEFDPPREVLAFTAVAPGERLFPGVWADPLDIVVQALTTHHDRRSLLAHLPDSAVVGAPDAQLAAMTPPGVAAHPESP